MPGDENNTITCYRCRVALTPVKTHFAYLGHSFQADMPTCPVCGQVYIPEEVASGRMAEVETMLEDK